MTNTAFPLPQDWREKARQFKYNLIAPLFALCVNLHEAPRYKAALQNPELEKAFMVILGLEDIAQYPEIVRHHEEGSYFRRVQQGMKHSWLSIFMHMSMSGFAGLLCWLGCVQFEVPSALTAICTGLSGHMGAEFIKIVEGRFQSRLTNV